MQYVTVLLCVFHVLLFLSKKHHESKAYCSHQIIDLVLFDVEKYLNAYLNGSKTY